MEDMAFKRAENILRENIMSLLVRRRYEQKDLADWCGHTKSWLNKVLNGYRGLPVEELDRVADFFGLVAYQLFQPGISSMSERRLGTDRRSGADRRIGRGQMSENEKKGDILSRMRKTSDGSSEATNKQRHQESTNLAQGKPATQSEPSQQQQSRARGAVPGSSPRLTKRERDKLASLSLDRLDERPAGVLPEPGQSHPNPRAKTPKGRK